MRWRTIPGCGSTRRFWSIAKWIGSLSRCVPGAASEGPQIADLPAYRIAAQLRCSKVSGPVWFT